MKIIHINVDSIQQALKLSVNSPEMVKAINTLIAEGFVLEIVQEYPNKPVEKLFFINTPQEYEKWIKAGAPENWIKQ